MILNDQHIDLIITKVIIKLYQYNAKVIMMIKQERFYKLFNSLPQNEKDSIVRTAIRLSELFKNSSISELLKESRYHAKEAMRPFRFKKQRIHHATLFAAVQYAMSNHITSLQKVA